MNWAHDNAFLSDQKADLERIFKYSPRAALAIKLVESHGYRMQIWPLETDDEWSHWLHTEVRRDNSERGLILILATRSGEQQGSKAKLGAMTYSEWLEDIEGDNIQKIGNRRTQTFAALSEKRPTTLSSHETTPQTRQPDIRTLPFSYECFRNICQIFRVHASITKAITRNNVPSFAGEKVAMCEEAYVYNCRTPNAWPSDMALSATAFPELGLTYAIFYGCTTMLEISILKSLQGIGEQVCHPLILPGIFVELELLRHKSEVEASIVEVETKIFELDFLSGATEGPGRYETESQHEAKRTAWLDLTYLRNSLISWNVQIQKMSGHTLALSGGIYNLSGDLRPDISEYDTRNGVVAQRKYTKRLEEDYVKIAGSKDAKEVDLAFLQRMHHVGRKIQLRLDTIQAEYEEKIRDCSMRVDGMAMATQWSHSETAVEMALATNRESKVMKSISLVTMVFLPGTFFATVFSMTFFDWFGSDGTSRVSSYLWIYIVVTVVFTAVTIGMWYFFVIYRRTGRRAVDEEKSKIG